MAFDCNAKHMEVVARIARKSLASFWPDSFVNFEQIITKKSTK